MPCDVNSLGDSNNNLNLNQTTEKFIKTKNKLIRYLSNSVTDQANDFKNKTLNNLSSKGTKESTLHFINRKNSHEFFISSLRFNEKDSLQSNNQNAYKKILLTKPQSPKLRTKERHDERNRSNLN